MQLLAEVLDDDEIALFLKIEDKFGYIMEVFSDFREVLQGLPEYRDARGEIEKIQTRIFEDSRIIVTTIDCLPKEGKRFDYVLIEDAQAI